MTAMTRDPGDSNDVPMPRSVKVSPDGKEDFLAAVHRSGRCDGHLSSAVVEPGAYLAAARLLLVGRLSQWMV